MIELFVVYDPTAPGYRVLCSSANEALSYHKGVIANYGSAPNIEHHGFPDTPSLIAFLTENFQEYQAIDVE